MRHKYILYNLANKVTGGTKPILAARLATDLQTPLLKPLRRNSSHRILSIDMGIRNLALCLVHVSPSQTPKITDWNRVTVSQKPDAENSKTESFEPIEYAAKAYEIIKTSLETYDPHTVLIERQRYRSAGGAAIQEWTVRVNMLESMFHAILYTLKMDRGKEFDVYSVSPRKVTQLWLEDNEEKLNARETKVAKIAVAERIIAREVDVVGQAKEIAEGFNCSKRGGGPKKFDDLADSMLQGLGWWRWHVNRLAMVDEILAWEDVVKTTKKTKEKADKVPKSRRRKAVAEEQGETKVVSKVKLLAQVDKIGDDMEDIAKPLRRKALIEHEEVRKPRRKRADVKLLEL
jgi:cruciform cutting endonuclease 1